MINYRNLTLAITLATGFLTAAPALAGPETAVVVEKTTKHHYVYYGDRQIYFAPETKTYYWRTDGAWQSGATLPSEDLTYVKTGGVEMDLDTDHPYERHEWVVKHYKPLHDGDAKRDRDDHSGTCRRQRLTERWRVEGEICPSPSEKGLF